MDLQEVLNDIKLVKNINDLYKLNKEKNRKLKRRWWVRPILLTREISGYFKSYFEIILESDEEELFRQTRMNKQLWSVLLNLVQDKLTKTSIRPAIKAECRLALTLCFLAQGVPPTFLASSFKLGRSTVRKIITETCDIIWNVLSLFYVCRPKQKDYLEISKDYWKKWNLPNCVGAIDGKHINLKCPPRSGSQFFNYKKQFSIILLASCDANYIFTNVAIGAYGSESDGGVFQNSTFGRELIDGQLSLPAERNLPNSGQIIPFYFVTDAAFPLKKNLMRPYAKNRLTTETRVFNLRLSRARNTIENAFGILASRWRILLTTINMFPLNVEKIVLASIALHNYIKLTDQSMYTPPMYDDWGDTQGNMQEGLWRSEVENPLISVSDQGSRNAAITAFEVRNIFTNFVNNEGALAWQYDRI